MASNTAAHTNVSTLQLHPRTVGKSLSPRRSLIPWLMFFPEDKSGGGTSRETIFHDGVFGNKLFASRRSHKGSGQCRNSKANARLLGSLACSYKLRIPPCLTASPPRALSENS